MSPDENTPFDELLRSALSDEADGITPAGDGLARIQQRIRQREGRMRWMRPAIALGSVAALALAGVGVAAVISNSGNDRLAPEPPASTPSETPSETPTTTPIATETFPAQAIFPFTSVDAEQGWEQDYASGGTQWEADPTQVSLHWVQDFLDQPGVDRVVDQQDDGKDKLVTLGRVLAAEGHNLFKVTVVHLTKYGHAWIVTGASDPNNYLSFSTPEAGGAIDTPVTVTGPAFGVDEAVKIDVRDATSTTSYGTTTVSFGNGTGQWRGHINFNRPTSPVGVLVAVDTSMADGGPSRIAAQQVQFAPATPHQPPAYFYAIKNNRITQFASRTGDSIKYLTSEQPGGGLQDPQVYGSEVYYLQGAGTCANGLMKVSTSADGGATGDIVASPDTGYIISSYAIGPVGYSFVETACDPARSPQGQLVIDNAPGRNVIDFQAYPPEIIGDPSYEPAAAQQFIDAYVRTGNEGYLTRYDAVNGTSATPDRRACPGLGPEDGQPAAIETDASGTLWIALQTGSSMDVVHCAPGGNPKQAFTIPGNDQPADIDVTSDGSAVLLTDDNGKVWRWDGSGNPTELTTSLPLDHVTW